MSVLLYVVCFYLACTSSPNKNPQQGSIPKYPQEQDYLNIPTPLSPKMFYDVDMKLKAELEGKKEFASVQRLFEVLAWQQFIALNWPTDAGGKPKPNLSDTGRPIWEQWEESFEVFRADGSAPTADFDCPEDIKKHVDYKSKPKILFRTNKRAAHAHAQMRKHAKADSANELTQAFSDRIWDQNGNVVRYEIRLNKKTVDYLVKNELYNFDGQIAFSEAGKKVEFPSGTREEEGTIELKIAWKILTDADVAERYFHTEAYVINENENGYTKKKVGLVGMHIASKTKSSPQWIWTTFEHVDNLETNPLQKVNGKSIKPSFYDPDNSIAAVNRFPDTSKKPVKNQIQRVLPITQDTQELNRQAQALLAEAKSPLQYYQLIGSQWPTDPTAKPYQPTIVGKDTTYNLPDAITNKSGGRPTPVYLTNMVMETYFQGASETNIKKYFEIKPSDVQHGYNFSLGNQPAWAQIEGATPANQKTIVFGTESCIGCHASASIAIGKKKDKDGKDVPVFGEPFTGDFEWLMKLKASFKATK